MVVCGETTIARDDEASNRKGYCDNANCYDIDLEDYMVELRSMRHKKRAALLQLLKMKNIES